MDSTPSASDRDPYESLFITALNFTESGLCESVKVFRFVTRYGSE